MTVVAVGLGWGCWAGAAWHSRLDAACPGVGPSRGAQCQLRLGPVLGWGCLAGAGGGRGWPPHVEAVVLGGCGALSLCGAWACGRGSGWGQVGWGRPAVSQVDGGDWTFACVLRPARWEKSSTKEQRCRLAPSLHPELAGASLTALNSPRRASPLNPPPAGARCCLCAGRVCQRLSLSLE